MQKASVKPSVSLGSCETHAKTGSTGGTTAEKRCLETALLHGPEEFTEESGGLACRRSLESVHGRTTRIKIAKPLPTAPNVIVSVLGCENQQALLRKCLAYKEK